MSDESGQSTAEDNRKYVFLIIKIIFLTNIPALALLLANFKGSIGWILGTLGSAVNFWWMARNALAMKPTSGKANAIKFSKTTMMRMLFLVCYCLAVMIVIKPELGTFCVGLFMAQIAIVLNHFYTVLRYGKMKKYFDENE